MIEGFINITVLESKVNNNDLVVNEEDSNDSEKNNSFFSLSALDLSSLMMNLGIPFK